MRDYGRIAHEAYEEAAAQSGWETNPASRVPWEDVPPENQAATRAAANAVANVVRGEEDRFRIGMEFGRSTEREAIVKWLRSCLCDTCNENAIGIERGVHVNEAIVKWLRSCLCDTCNENAIGIERGAHLDGEE